MGLRQQAALEFLITYSWAFLIISLFVVSVFLLSGTRAPLAYLQSSCNIQPLLPCTETLLTYNAVSPLLYYVVFTNQLGSVLYFPQNSLNLSISASAGNKGTIYSHGFCTPDFASPGATVLCIANVPGSTKVPIGTETIIDFSLNYRICNTDNSISCTLGTYRSSGYSVQNLAPGSVGLYNLTFMTSPAGTIVLNGVTYFSGTSEYLPSGKYVIYAQPAAQNGAFLSWSVNAPSSVLKASAQNTTLTLSANAVLTARFS